MALAAPRLVGRRQLLAAPRLAEPGAFLEGQEGLSQALAVPPVAALAGVLVEPVVLLVARVRARAEAPAEPVARAAEPGLLAGS